MKNVFVTVSLSIAVAFAASGCAIAEDSPTSEEAARTDEQQLSVRHLARRLRAALNAMKARHRTHDGTIAVLRFPAEEEWPAVSITDVKIYEGPSPEARTCKFENVDGCELRTCRDVVEPGNVTNVGPITFKGGAVQASVSPNVDGIYDSSNLDNLWNHPGDIVTSSYVTPSGIRVRTAQLAPAIDLSLTQAVPAVISRGQPVTVSWTGAKPGDTGAVFVSFMSAEGADMPGGGKLLQTVLTCSAPPASGGTTFSARALARLPAGSYVMSVQAESRAEDFVGIDHQLISMVKDGFAPFVVQ